MLTESDTCAFSQSRFRPCSPKRAGSYRRASKRGSRITRIRCASAYGVAEDELQAFYRGRSKLGVNVYPEDVAEAIAFFAGPRSAKSTGNVVNVDGGVTAAYPR